MEINMDSHAVVTNNRKRAHVLFIHFTPMLTSFKTIVRYYNKDANSEIIHLSYANFPSFTCTLCVCVCVCALILYSFITSVFVYP